MARYIDADKFIKQFERALETQQKYGLYPHAEITQYVIKAIENEVTADVVPKSEVEELKQDLEIAKIAIENRNIEIEGMRTAANSYKMHYEKARQEVAREIFEEIEKAVEDAEFEWGTIYGVKLCLAELKKKYTENLNG